MKFRPADPRLQLALLSLLTGALFGLAFPPVRWSWLVWVCLVPLLLAIRLSHNSWQAATTGGAAGLAAFLIAAYPLTSASVWSGWMSVSAEGLSSLQTRQWWFLHGLWVLISVVIAGSWAAFAALVRWLKLGTAASLVVIPAAWIVLTEWARSAVLWGFQWSFLGNAAAAFDSIRQTTALGGVWLLSALVMAVNVGVAESLSKWIRKEPRPLAPLLFSVGLLIAAQLYGSWRLHQTVEAGESLNAVALQGERTSYVASDFLDFGLDRDYYTMLREAVEDDVDLVVLPESVSYGPISLDGSEAPGRDPNAHRSIGSWNAALGSFLFNTRKTVLIGADTVEEAEPHNSMIGWHGGQLAGWYHKVRLVPFSEYRPRLWGRQAIRGRRGFVPGQGVQLIQAGDVSIGAFICQEVQFPQQVRGFVRAGAELLVTGGNDGVFGSPAVAQVHDDFVTLRATESGRYIVRAMKNGLSSIVDPFGNHVDRLGVGEAGVVRGVVYSVDRSTVYVRFGDWVLWLALVLTISVATVRLRRAPDHHG